MNKEIKVLLSEEKILSLYEYIKEKSKCYKLTLEEFNIFIDKEYKEHGDVPNLYDIIKKDIDHVISLLG